MRKLKKYQDDDEDFLHPFWLGLLMLFIVIIVTGMMCFLRRKFGSYIRHLIDRLCGRDPLDRERHLKLNPPLPSFGRHNWAPYIPPPSSPSKSYKFIRNIQMQNLEKDSSSQRTESNEDSIGNDVFSIFDESDQVKVPSFQSKTDRSSEAARKFYASMRYTSQYQNSASLDSHTSDIPTNQ